ncbi:MAG: hypothetical protein M1840_000425 [Geoglossum simile]|nr:MAG: hypothetical protein M1840_000425 [Geoglossum simile]
MSNGAQNQSPVKWWRRYKVTTTLKDCFKLGRTTQEEPCPVHYYLGEPSELAAAPATARFDGKCNARYEIGYSATHMADSNSVFEIGPSAAGRVYEIGPGTPRCELPAESVPLLAYPTQTYQPIFHSAYTNHPLDVDAGPLTIDELLGPYSPVSPISPDGSGSISGLDFTIYSPAFDHSPTLGAESITPQGLVAPNHDLVMSDSYNCSPVGIDDQTDTDPQAGPVDSQSPHGLHLEASEDLARLHHTVSTVKRALSKVVYELTDNSAVAFGAVQISLRHDQGLWLRDYVMPFSSPNSLLERCLQALRKVVLGSPMTPGEACYEMFYLKYFAVTAIRIPRGFCVWEHERYLSQCEDPSVCMKVVKDVCIRTLDLMCYFETIRRRLDGLPNMARPILRQVSYIKETIVPALLREPRMDVFKRSVTDAVDCLDTQRLHDLHDVAVRLIYAVHCEGQLYIDFVTSVILTSHAALVDTSGPQPTTTHIGMIDELIYAVAEPTPTTPYRAPSALLYSDKGKRPTRVSSPTDSGYYSSPTTPPNAPREEENFGSPTKRLRTHYNASQHPARPSAPPRPVRPAAQRPYPPHINAPAPLQITPPSPNEPLLKCNYCNYQPKPHPDWRYRKSNLTRHEKDLHREKGFKHICPAPACGEAVGRLDNFKNHLSKHPELYGITTAEVKACRIRIQS